MSKLSDTNCPLAFLIFFFTSEDFLSKKDFSIRFAKAMKIDPDANRGNVSNLILIEYQVASSKYQDQLSSCLDT